MKSKKLYQILPFVMVGICVVGMGVVGTRIFAKKVLIGKLGIENYVTCTLADYNWGDRLERRMPEENAGKIVPERQRELEEILAGAPVADAQKKAEADVADASGDEAKNADAEGNAGAGSADVNPQNAAETGSVGAGNDANTDSAGKMPVLEKISAVTEQWSGKVKTAEDDIVKYSNEKFMFYPQMRDLSRGFDTLTAWNLAYARIGGSTYALNTGFDYQAVEEKDMTEYAGDVITKASIAQNAGVDFLYVQYPYRVDEEKSQVPWGASAEENANADEALRRLREASVDTLDLREALPGIGWDYNTGFYDTDGHWTTRSGFLSAGLVAEYMNENYGFQYDMSYFDEAKYNVKSYDLNSYMVKEEVELFLPDFETKFNVVDAYRKEAYTGNFEEACFDMSKADTKEYSTVLTAYSASRIRNSYLFEYQNLERTNNGKRILVCSDSFSWHLIPYLALDTEYVDYVYRITPEQMEYYIEKLQPDAVIVLDRP